MPQYRNAILSGPGFTVELTERRTAGPNDAILEPLDGWYGGAGVEGDNPKRTLGHGLFITPSTRTGRPLTLRGVLVYQSAAERDLAQRLLSGVLWDGELGDLTVTDAAGLTLSARVKLDGALKAAELGPRAVRFEAPLLAPDPFLVSEERVQTLRPAGTGEGLEWPLFTGGALRFGAGADGSRTVINNAGGATSWPRFAVRGTFPAGFRITAGASVIEYPSPVYAQTPVLIDTAAGSITLDGYGDVTTRATRRDWRGFGIEAGKALQPRLHALADSVGWVDVLYSDTYI